MKKLLVSLALPLLGLACAPGADNNAASPPVAENSAMNQTAMDNSATNQAEMDHSTMNHAAMDHASMQSAPDAAKAPYDLQFLDTMMAHHQGAVEMAQMIESRTNNAELKKFGAQVVAAQEKEIAQMKSWRERWFAGKPSALNMEMPGMADSMKMDMSQLAAAKNADFDRAFVQMMIPHHVGAIEMSQEALKKAAHPEIKTLATQIIKDQQAEIEKMRAWEKDWAR